MRSSLFTLIPTLGLACATIQKRTNPSSCHADNCLRAIRATSILPQASLDCSSFLVATATPPPVTVTVTSTTSGIAKRVPTPAYYDPIPTYASACTDTERYSSACSCIGITPSTTTLAATSKTVTSIVTATPSCAGETCASGFVPTCNAGNSDCYCFTNAEDDGFCGENAPCISLTQCETDDDCAEDIFSSGDTCAFSTCCSDDDATGLCLVGSCPDPLKMLSRMAKAVGRDHLVGGTAAFRGE